MIKDFFDSKKIDYKENVSLRKYNTFRLDTICSYLVFPKNVDELILILKEVIKNNIKYFILGNGSNIIFSMAKYDGVIIKLDNFNNIEYKANCVEVGAGYSLSKLSIEVADKGLDGLTFAAGIPGTVGASVAMNAGAYNSDMSQVVKEAQVLDDKLNIITLKNADLNYSYRNSFLKAHKNYIVLSAILELEPGDKETIKNTISERRKKRMISQPLDMPSAGSVFRNPEGMYAGELIEKSNFKGYCIGDALVSPKHANFIVNKGNATGEDIIKLIEKIKKEVKTKYGVELVLEQIIVE